MPEVACRHFNKALKSANKIIRNMIKGDAFEGPKQRDARGNIKQH